MKSRGFSHTPQDIM